MSKIFSLHLSSLNIPLTPPPLPRRLFHNGTSEGRGSRGPKLLNAGLFGMGKARWVKIECLHRVGGPESKRLKVAALNLLHPTASPLFRIAVFLYYDTVSRGERFVVS